MHITKKANPLNRFRHVSGGIHNEYVCDSCHQTWLPETYEFFRTIVLDAVCPKCGKEATQRLHLVRHEWDESDAIKLEDTGKTGDDFIKTANIPGYEVIHHEWPPIYPGARVGDIEGPLHYLFVVRNRKTVILQSCERNPRSRPS